MIILASDWMQFILVDAVYHLFDWIMDENLLKVFHLRDGTLENAFSPLRAVFCRFCSFVYVLICYDALQPNFWIGHFFF